MAKINDNQLKALMQTAYETKNKGESLGKIFEKTAKKLNMAKGSVRNVYYNTLKKIEENEDYKQLVLGDKVLNANKIVEFSEDESEKLLKIILTGLTFGKSVRRVIAENTSDEKMALRYQNKYRNLLKYDREKVEKVCAFIKNEYGRCYNPFDSKPTIDFNLAKIKKEINTLYDKIAQSVREENDELKEKIKFYETENERLKLLLEEKTNSPVNEYFSIRKKLNHTQTNK